MYIGFFNYYENYNKNRMFIDPKASIGDDLLYPFVYLGQYLVKKGHEINTIDMEDVENFDTIVFLDFPTLKNKYLRQLISNKFQNVYLLIFESEVIRPDNWDIKNHQHFKKIFVWNDDWVDSKKYIKYYWPNKVPENFEIDLSKKSRLVTMIAGHKFNSHPLELYTERVKAIRWFEHNHPEDFDLYGMGWNTYCFKGALSTLNRFTFLTKHIRSNYPSYKGTVEKKRDVYERYKFSICYENARDIPGYITEKIFDCFFAGCVPIYWGAPNVTDFIPEDTFIDKRKFNSYEKLYDYIKNMTGEEYLGYLAAIKNFIKSPKIYPFSAECFADTIINEILKND